MILSTYTLMLVTALIFTQLTHPISMGLVLILHTLLIGLVTGLIGGSFWFSYILFLVFLGGVLVLFIYMTSLASNEKFTLGWGDMGYLGAVFCVAGVILVTVLCLAPMTGPEVNSCWWAGSGPTAGVGYLVMKFYSSYSYKLTLFLIFYLLYALVVCATMVGGYSGALRNFN